MWETVGNVGDFVGDVENFVGNEEKVGYVGCGICGNYMWIPRNCSWTSPLFLHRVQFFLKCDLGIFGLKLKEI